MVGRPNRRNKAVLSNSSSLKSVFEKPCLRDGLVWTVGLTVEIKLSFQIPPGSVIISYRSTPCPARVNFFVFSGPVWGWPRSRWSKQLCLTVL